MDASTDSSTGNAAEPANAVPPLPPTLRPKPQRRAIGIGKSYASTIEFNAEVAAWEAEKRARAELVKLRQKALDKQRDRSSRKRDVRLDETDSQRRVRQRHDNADATKSHAEQQSRRRGSCRLNEQIACCNSLDYKIVAALVKVVGSKFDITSPHAELERSALRQLLYQARFVLECSPDGTTSWDQEFKYFAGPLQYPTEYWEGYWRVYRRFKFDPWEQWEVMLLSRIVPLGDVNVDNSMDAWSQDAIDQWDEVLQDYGSQLDREVSGEAIVCWLQNKHAVATTTDGFEEWSAYVPHPSHRMS